MAWTYKAYLNAFSTILFTVSPGGTAHDSGRVIYWMSATDSEIYATTLSGTDLNGGSPVYTIPTTGSIFRNARGMALDTSTGIIYILIERTQTGNNGGELWSFDTANASDPGTVVNYGTGTEMRGHITYASDGYLYAADGFGSTTYLWKITPSTGSRTAVVTYTPGSGYVINRKSIATTPDGAVWFMVASGGNDYLARHASGSTSYLLTDTVHDPLAQADNTVIVQKADSLAYKVDAALTGFTRYPAADPDTGGGYGYISYETTFGFDLISDYRAVIQLTEGGPFGPFLGRIIVGG